MGKTIDLRKRYFSGDLTSKKREQTDGISTSFLPAAEGIAKEAEVVEGGEKKREGGHSPACTPTNTTCSLPIEERASI